MSFSPSPENNLIPRQLAGVRRDMREMMEREARTIEVMNRIAARVDEGFTLLGEDVGRVRRDMNAIRSDLVLMENRILTAITEVRTLAARVDEVEPELPSEHPNEPTRHG